MSVAWRRNGFVHWAISLMHFWSRHQGAFVLVRSRWGQETSWWGFEGCPYPYVTITQVAFDRLDQSVGRETREASPGMEGEHQLWRQVKVLFVCVLPLCLFVFLLFTCLFHHVKDGSGEPSRFFSLIPPCASLLELALVVGSIS
jgi:hypothetical protein